jgi:hypothetical protein
MPLPVPTESPSCAICSLALADGPTIPTTSGGTVHIRCAERQARAAARRRTLRAAITAVLLAGLLVALTTALGIAGWGSGAALAIVVVLHVCINGRWWSYMVQSARLRWRWQ